MSPFPDNRNKNKHELANSLTHIYLFSEQATPHNEDEDEKGNPIHGDRFGDRHGGSAG